MTFDSNKVCCNLINYEYEIASISRYSIDAVIGYFIPFFSLFIHFVDFLIIHLVECSVSTFTAFMQY